MQTKKTRQNKMKNIQKYTRTFEKYQLFPRNIDQINFFQSMLVISQALGAILFGITFCSNFKAFSNSFFLIFSRDYSMKQPKYSF